ncbi:MAG: hypothetical protein K9H14_03975 [Actinomycetia bacterium]|nr:hypothetical protein [Actinomycetes bacterium]
MAEKKTTKKLPVIIGTVISVAFIVLLIIFIPQILGNLNNQGATSQIIVPEKQEKEEEDDNQLYDQLEGNQDLIDTFSCFYYPDSEIKAFEVIEQDEDLLYLQLETDEDFGTVQDFYKSKKVQSVWSQSDIFESSTLSLEQQFLDGEASSLSAKFTYNSNQRDRVVNILINSMAENKTDIMIIYWNL